MHGREYPINPETPDKPSDPIMDDIVRLSAASSAFATYQYAIKDVLGVLMTETAQFIIKHALPAELMEYRSTLAAYEKVYDRFQGYFTELKAREDKKKREQSKETN